MPASLRARLVCRSNTRPYDRHSPAPSSSPALSDSRTQLQHPPNPDVDYSFPPVVPPPSPSPPIADRPGMPTYAQYKRIEANYLKGLSPRKRDKALIAQAMFDKIWDVLHQPEACSIETPQFRFWVRKMFTLGRPGVNGRDDGESDDDDDFDDGDGDDGGGREMPTAVVLHENRPVAVMEQLYELFCYCHERSEHGGRDKTCAVIRQHYSWVPKELTAQFVKACPTCTLKRSGNPEMVTLKQERETTPRGLAASGRGKKGVGEVMEERVERTASSSLGWPTTGGPLDPANPEPCGVRGRARGKENESERERDVRGENVGGPLGQELHALHDLSAHSSVDSSNSRIHPKPREAPQPPQEAWAWTLHGAAPFGDVPGSNLHDTNGRSGPKVANTVLPQGHSGESSKAVDRQTKPVSTMKLPSLTSALSNDSLDDKLNLSGLGTEKLDDTECLPPVLRQLQISEPANLKHQVPSYLFQIDPVLLSFDYPGSGTAVIPASGVEPPHVAFSTTGSDNGTALPPLDSGAPSGIARNATCMDTLQTLEGASDPRILPFWAELPSTLSHGAFRLGLTGSPPRDASHRDRDMSLSMDFEMGRLPEMDSDSPGDGLGSTSSFSLTDSPDSSLEYSRTGGLSSSAFRPFSFSSPVGCGSRYHPYGAPPFLLAGSPGMDDMGRELASTLSFPLITDDA